LRVIGVAGDAHYVDLREPPPPVVYLPMAQSPGQWSNAQLVVRGPAPLALVSAVTRAVDEAAPGLTVRRMRDMASQRDFALMLERLAARLGAFVSVMALLLSAVGLYGVVAYGVSRRTSEIGIRLALGASRWVVVWMVVRETLAVVALGVIVGLPLTYASNGALRSRLFGVGAHDPMAMVAAAVLLAITGLLASTIPARRAARVDPRITLVAD
jgi:predicted lysophospholipase L1 biosynthesis ABC-type transport system permease subunit